jgi:uroporphyrin-III C-methyltransferase
LSKGKVYIVGAGPGDPRLLTLRAFELLRIADVVVYDRLVSEEVLSFVKKDAKLVCAENLRKKGGQAAINEFLVDQAKRGLKVIRLKGGDPFVFSRGGEEALSLFESGVKFEVVPGVSSALAAPVYAGIPLTHRGVSSCFAVVTGHEYSLKNKTIDWRALCKSVDTLVILMGAKNFDKIAKTLLDSGLSANTPVAAIEWATTKRQKVSVFSLEDALKSFIINPPAVIIVGRVVELCRKISWFKAGVSVE